MVQRPNFPRTSLAEAARLRAGMAKLLCMRLHGIVLEEMLSQKYPKSGPKHEKVEMGILFILAFISSQAVPHMSSRTGLPHGIQSYRVQK